MRVEPAHNVVAGECPRPPGVGPPLRALLAGIVRGIEQALYPDLCWLCRLRPTQDGLGCPEHALDACGFDPTEARCGGCLARLPAGLRSGPCARCRREGRGYERLLAGGAYGAGSLREWILAFKHGGRADLARPLGCFLAESVRRAGALAPGVLLVPVPLHPLRRLERGYDQSELLCEELAARLGLVHVRALRRARWTAPQGSAGAASRAANVEGAFRVRSRALATLAGRSLWLVDDVVTSGATVRACVRALRLAHVREVTVLALARAEREPRPAGAGSIDGLPEEALG